MNGRDPIFMFFAYSHLKPELQAISMPFCKMAAWMESMLPDNAERAVGLRKLLEAKDCAVRASISKASE